MINHKRVNFPPQLKIFFEKLDNNPDVIHQIELLYKKYVNSIFGSHSTMEHKTYGDKFKIPGNITKELMRIVGLTKDQLIDAFANLHAQKTQSDAYTVEGFKKNNMYTNPDYLVHLVFLLYSVYKAGKLDINKNDPYNNIAKYAISIIFARLWTGRIMRYYPTGYDEKIGAYVQNFMLNKRFKLRTYKTPTEMILYDYTPKSIDHINSINLNEHPEEIVYVFTRMWGKLNGLIKRVTGLYIQAYKEGKKLETVDSHMVTQNETGQGTGMVEKYNTLKSEIESIVDEIKMNIILVPKHKIPEGLLKKFMVTPYMIDKNILKHIFMQFTDESNNDEVGEIIEQVLEYIVDVKKIQNLSYLCSYSLDFYNLAENIVKTKRDPRLMGIKRNIDDLLRKMIDIDPDTHPNKMEVSNYRRVVLFLIVLFILTHCNKQIKYIEIK